jgi:hypothetical protein
MWVIGWQVTIPFAHFSLQRRRVDRDPPFFTVGWAGKMVGLEPPYMTMASVRKRVCCGWMLEKLLEIATKGDIIRTGIADQAVVWWIFFRLDF